MKIRNHFSTIFNKFFSMISFLAVLIYFSFQLFTDDIYLKNKIIFYQIPIFIALSAFIFFYILYLMGNYFFTFIEIKNDYIVLRNRFFSNRKIILPYANIHSFSYKIRIIDEFFDTRKIFIDSGSFNEKVEINITIKNKYAKILEEKIDILMKRNSQEDSYKKITITSKWLMFNALLLPAKWVRYISIILSIVTVIIITITNTSQLPLWIIILSYIASLAISILINTIYISIKYKSFSLINMGNYLLIKYGNIIKNTFYIPYEKINGILIKQSPIDKITKTFHPFLYIVGYKNTKEDFSLPLFPIANEKIMDRILYDFIPFGKEKIKKSSLVKNTKKFYFISPLLATNILFLPLVIIFSIYGEFLFVPILILANALIIKNSDMAYKNSIFEINDKIIYAKNGGLQTNEIICKKNSIQAIKLQNNIFNRKKNIAKIFIFIKSLKGKAFKINYQSTKDFDFS